ncbi:MAG TPA: hypothetical protein VF351_00620 [Actinomycetota bacterium]
MRNGSEEPHEQDPGSDDPTDDDRETEPASAKTRAGSNLPNAAGNRDDGTHE